MKEVQVGKVAGIALRSAKTGPMREVPEASAVVDGGLVGDVPSSAKRGVTFLSARQWRELTAELRVALPWHTRRANILVEAGALSGLIGKTVRVGGMEVAVQAETRPCELMDKLHPGLRTALTPDCRGGVNGRVVKAGDFKIGDVVTVVEM